MQEIEKCCQGHPAGLKTEPNQTPDQVQQPLSDLSTSSPLCASKPQGIYPHPFKPQTLIACHSSLSSELSCPSNPILHPSFDGCQFIDPGSDSPGKAQRRHLNVVKNPIIKMSNFRCTGRLDGNYPDPEDCGQFYSCSGGVAWLCHCPDNLHYNPNSNRCEYPDVVNCSPPSALDDEDGSPSPIHCKDITPNFDCTGKPDGNYPDPDECAKFYKCSGQVLLVVCCSDGLGYNPNTNKCEYPDDSFCPPGT